MEGSTKTTHLDSTLNIMDSSLGFLGRKLMWRHCVPAIVVVLVAVTDYAANAADSSTNDWQTLWQQSEATMPKPVTVSVGTLGDLGKDLEDRQWQMVPTRYHQLYFQASADPRKVAELYQLLDGVYVFLNGRSHAKPQTPIQAFLVPDEYGHSRCTQNPVAMRTGERAEVQFLLTSLLHEETHLFNFAFLGQASRQNWWCGEFSCIYFQERALLQAEGKDLKTELKSRLPNGPIISLPELDSRGQRAFDEAVAALFFFEEQYGRAKLNEFRQQCLISAKSEKSDRAAPSVFQEAFGKDATALDKEWREFYGWPNKGPETQRGVPDRPYLEQMIEG